MNQLYAHAAQLYGLSRVHHVQVYLPLQAVFLQLSINQTQCQRGAVNGQRSAFLINKEPHRCGPRDRG